MTRQPMTNGERSGAAAERGSALILSVFVLALLASMGIALLFISDGEMQMSRANLRTNKVFFLAEAGIENARETLFQINGNGDFSDDLVAAAGPDGTIDFDMTTVQPSYDSNGNFTGFTGFNDDVPVKTHVCSVTTSTMCSSNADCPGGETCNKNNSVLGDGFYSVFLTNDPAENRTNTTDVNERVMLTGLGVGPDRSVEVAQAVIEMHSILPTVPPATVTMLGPAPEFYSSRSKVKDYLGDDCGSPGGLAVPVFGLVGPSAEAAAETGIQANPDYQSGIYSDQDVFADLTDNTEPTVAASGMGTLDSRWQDCQHILDMLEELREYADNVCHGSLYCDPTTPCHPCDPSTTTPQSITFIEGDYRVQGNMHGYGTLVVTGRVEFGGGVDWDGLILPWGEGEYYLNGGGNGTVQGGMIVANVSGPDGVMGGRCAVTKSTRCLLDSDCPMGEVCTKSNDDCTGGVKGFDSALVDENGGGNSGTVYCSTVLKMANPVKPYEVVEFKQW